jgi:hypothetical protein
MKVYDFALTIILAIIFSIIGTWAIQTKPIFISTYVPSAPIEEFKNSSLVAVGLASRTSVMDSPSPVPTAPGQETPPVQVCPPMTPGEPPINSPMPQEPASSMNTSI